jgi:hypothetical protein
MWLWFAAMFWIAGETHPPRRYDEIVFVSAPALFTIYLGLVAMARALVRIRNRDAFAATACLAPLVATCALFVIGAMHPLPRGSVGYALVSPIILFYDTVEIAPWHDAMLSWGVWLQLAFAILAFAVADSLLRERAAPGIRIRRDNLATPDPEPHAHPAGAL